MKFINLFICFLIGHKIYNPGKWESGWWSNKGWNHFSLCKCCRCGNTYNHKILERFKWYYD